MNTVFGRDGFLAFRWGYVRVKFLGGDSTEIAVPVWRLLQLVVKYKNSLTSLDIE